MSLPVRAPSQMTHQRSASHEHRKEDRAQGRSGQGRRQEDRRPGSEIYPLAVPGAGTSGQAATLWTANLVITLSPLPILGRIGAGPTMWLYAAFNVAAWLFIWRKTPELTGRSLEQIEGQLYRARFRPRDFKHDKAEPAAASTTGPA
jgi:hypothetical protein